MAANSAVSGGATSCRKEDLGRKADESTTLAGVSSFKGSTFPRNPSKGISAERPVEYVGESAV
jgi:hypothetical protein